MRALKFLSLAMVAAGAIAATPAAAVVTTFATYSAVAGANVRFVNSGNSTVRANDGVMYTTSTPTGTTPGSVLVNFSFLQPLIAPFVTNVSALYTLNAVVAANSAATPTTGAFTQPGLSGTFSFVTTAPIVISGPGFFTTFYAAGSNLLSGSFSNGTILGSVGGSAGSSTASGDNGVTITYTSDFLDFSDAVSLDRAQSLTAVAPTFLPRTGPNFALRSFRAVAGGQFSSDPAPVISAVSAVPEPASWAMLVLGFGIVGVASRSRKRRTVLA